MREEYLIQSISDLRAVIEEPHPQMADKVLSKIDAYCRRFINHSPLVFISTSDGDNNQDVSPKGDEPGFVKVLDEHTILVPERPGNKLAYGFQNMLETGKAGLIFVVPGVRETVRVNGTVSISRDPELLEMLASHGKSAILCTIVKVDECFFHCGKAFIRSKLWKPDYWEKDFDPKVVKQISSVIEGLDESSLQDTVDEEYKNNLY